MSTYARLGQAVWRAGEPRLADQFVEVLGDVAVAVRVARSGQPGGEAAAEAIQSPHDERVACAEVVEAGVGFWAMADRSGADAATIAQLEYEVALNGASR